MSNRTAISDPNGKFETVIPESMPEIFADGMSQFLLGVPISKIIFHTLITPATKDEEIEKRQGVLRLAIPTPILLEICRNVLVAARDHIDAIGEAGSMADSQVRKMMDGISITVDPAEL